MGNGSWEREGPSVLVAILTREIVTMKWALGLRNLGLPPMFGISVRSGAPYDVMRNNACEDALKAGFQRVLFLDDDVIAPPDTYVRLAQHNQDIVSGLYYRRHEPVLPVAMKMDMQGQPQWVQAWDPPNSLVEVDYVGAGCLLIHRRVLEQTPRPWFEWEIGKKDGNALSEDFAFCRNAKRVGFKVLLDTSVKCEHIGIGQASAMDGSFKPSALP
jgi:hypothetical protein